MLEGRIYGKTEKSPVAELAWSNTTSLSGRKQGSCLTMQATHQLADQGGLTHLPEGSCIIIIRTSPLKLSCKVRAALNRSKFKAQSRDLNRKNGDSRWDTLRKRYFVPAQTTQCQDYGCSQVSIQVADSIQYASQWKKHRKMACPYKLYIRSSGVTP